MTGFIMMSLLLAAPPQRHDGAQLLNDLRRVDVLGTVLYVAAHPDDENTRLLASFANEAKFRTAYLSFTRGEGGQNLIGPELGAPLGVIRTQELLAARRVDGAEQYFTRARDFGYSKSVDETLATWDHDRVLADAVLLIRTLRPDLIVTRFSPEPTGTHGHHTASARLALEAFHAAADPKYHPEQLATLEPWQARRIFWNAWSPDPKVKLPEGMLTWDSSQFSPLLGLSYGELAAESRSMHKSQGFGAAPVHDGSVENFALLAGEPATTSIFDGLDTSWRRVPGAETFSAALGKALAGFKVDAPAASIPSLLTALEELRKLPPNPWKAQKEQELVEVIVNAAGLFVESAAAAPSVVPGGKVELKVLVLNRSPAALKLEEVRVLGARVAPAAVLERGKAFKAELAVDVPANLEASSPYYLEQRPSKGTWSLAERHPVNAPELLSPFLVEYRLTAGTQALTLRHPAYFKWTDPTVGERYRPIEVLPPVVVAPGVELLGFTDGTAKPLEVTVTANADGQRGEVKLELPAGFSSEPESVPFQLEKGQQAVVGFKVRPVGARAAAAVTEALTVVAQVGEARFSRALARIEYPHIPIQAVLAPAQVKLMRVDLKRGKTTRVGYVAGAGDDVPAALRQVGYDVTMLSDAALRTEPLSRFDAIVLGVRAYNVNARLPSVTPRLLDYVKAGGTLLLQYNTKNWLSSVPAQLGPYPFELSQDRVTDEEAKVTWSAHPVLRAPNALAEADFSGWVQERGLYFSGRWDERYETPLSMADPGEKPSQGSLLVAKHGKGRFVYTGLAFFRQLPAGVPGAYRLFANLLHHGR
jgi:LmbE family N-acetylglucosaminyl deacetylase